MGSRPAASRADLATDFDEEYDLVGAGVYGAIAAALELRPRARQGRLAHASPGALVCPGHGSAGNPHCGAPNH